ncbi:MAG: restriction endonuclease [Pseudomonadales bacterium]|jgi:restriction system protein|nr:restriction endonuclease [Pseudomonadales bacterium]
MWMVRSGRGAEYIDDFMERSIIAIGWAEAGEIPGGSSRDAVLKHFRGGDADNGNRFQLSASAGQVFRFLTEMKTGDNVVTYDPRSRIYHVGRITSEPRWAPDVIERLPRQRSVKWIRQVNRDDLSSSARNTLGAISTLFAVTEPAAAELLGRETGGGEGGGGGDEQPTYESIRESAYEQIKDRITKLDPDEFERLVAGLLRAMGYKTRVTPKGPDRGVDIVASPDGLGFEPPRVVVECKHRTRSQMGAQDIRSFLGGRHPDDKGLYVSTGGFTKDARYEAERASIPLTLMDFEQLVASIVDHYETFDSEARALLPLGRLYWPISP